MKFKILNRYIFGWCLFDFAAAVLMVNGGLYFPTWLTIDNRVPDFLFNAAILVSAAIVLLAGPPLGRLVDRVGRPKLFLAMSAVAMFTGTILLRFLDMYIGDTSARVACAVSLFLLILCSYQLGTIFYNSIFKHISTAESANPISGWGTASSWLGSIIGVLFVLPFVRGLVPTLSGGRAEAFVPASVAFGLLAILSLSLLPGDHNLKSENREKQRVTTAMSIGQLIRSGTLFWFLASFALCMDALLTIQNNLPIFLERALHFSQVQQAFVVLTLSFGAAAGGLISIWLLRRWAPFRVFRAALLLWIPLILAIAISTRTGLSFVWFGSSGILLAITTSSARVLFVRMIPEDRAAELFGYYNSFERTASLIGPLFWSAALSLAWINGGDAKYRVAFALMAGLSALAVAAGFRMRPPEVPPPST